MKYLSIGIGILAVLLAVCIFSSVWVAKSVETAQAALSEAVQALNRGDLDAAMLRGEDAATQWNRHANVFGVFLSHEEIDEISVGFSNLRAYADNGASEDYRVCCAELLFRLSHIAQMDIPFYYNFL